MNYYVVKSFNAYQNDLEGKSEIESLSAAIAFIKGTSDGHLWATKPTSFDGRVGSTPAAEMTVREVSEMSEADVVRELESQFID